jgi:hypothetical protein
MRDRYDRSSKWLITHHGDAILHLAGVGAFRSWRAVPNDVVQPRRLPDGLLEVVFPDQETPDLFLVARSALTRSAASTSRCCATRCSSTSIAKSCRSC